MVSEQHVQELCKVRQPRCQEMFTLQCPLLRRGVPVPRLESPRHEVYSSCAV